MKIRFTSIPLDVDDTLRRPNTIKWKGNAMANEISFWQVKRQKQQTTLTAGF